MNIHVETSESSSRKFKDLMDLYDLKQHVVGPTHIMGHTIDVIITPNKEFYVTEIAAKEIDLSHHFLINFKVMVLKNMKVTKTMQGNSGASGNVTFKKNVSKITLGRRLAMPLAVGDIVKEKQVGKAGGVIHVIYNDRHDIQFQISLPQPTHI